MRTTVSCLAARRIGFEFGQFAECVKINAQVGNIFQRGFERGVWRRIRRIIVLRWCRSRWRGRTLRRISGGDVSSHLFGDIVRICQRATRREERA
jgi:hypothetical protein